MAITFEVFKGSPNGIVKATSTREVGRNDAVVKITHSGVCGTDEHAIQLDMGLGHEGVGIVTEIGPDVQAVKVGDRVGFGYAHYFCRRCEPCLTGWDNLCENRRFYFSDDQDEGSFGTYVVWDADSLHILPDAIDSLHAGPLMCGGATVWTALTMYNVHSTDRVGIVGVGGLGHLAIQIASKMGCEVVVFSGSESKREEALAFGATEFHVTKGVTELKGIKKVKHLLITASQQQNLDLYVPIMAASGTVYPLTVNFDSTPIHLLQFVLQGIAIQGSVVAPWNAIKKLLDFAVLHNIQPTIMTWPMTLEGVESALKTLGEGKMRYRGVLVA